MKSGCCTICLEPLFKDIQVSSECGHVFHRSCIYRWIDRSNSCPNCKQHCDASNLTNLFLDPLEIIKEVLNDPTVLENVDPDLLLKIYSTDTNKGAQSDDLDLLDVKTTKKPNNMSMIQERIKNSALTSKNNELCAKVSELSGNIRNIEDENSKLHKKMQSYLNTARKYEQKFFDLEDKVKKLNIEMFKKNKELNSKKKEMNDVIRKQLQYEHQENIMIGNTAAVHEMERRISEGGKSKEEQAVYWLSMYQWIKKEYAHHQSDRERDKKGHHAQQKKWSEIHEEQRIKIETLTENGMKNIDRANKYKKHYFDLKERYTKLREEFKKINKKCTDLRANKIPEIDALNIHKNEDENDKENQEQDEIVSVSYDENEDKDEDENEDDDLQVPVINTMNTNSIDSVFSYPHSGNHHRQRGSTSRSLFGAYHKLRSKKDGTANPFSSNANRKRNFRDLTKADDGRGGTKTFLTESTNNYNNNRNKRRRVVKTSSNAKRSNNNRHKHLNFANFFKK